MKTGIGGEQQILAQSAPFVAPLLVFMIFLSVESYFPEQHYVLYPIKTVLVAAILAWFWQRLPSLKPSSVIISAAIGIICVVLWIGIDPVSLKIEALWEQLYNSLFSALGWTSWLIVDAPQNPMGSNPFHDYPTGVAWTLFGCRVVGITLCVPVMEELFWRAFLMRWLIKEDFTSVPLGAYLPLSFWVTTLFFASVHGAEWPQALVVGTIYGAWFVRTKNLGNVMLAHGVTNFLLAFYCLFSNDWHFLCAACPAPMPK